MTISIYGTSFDAQDAAAAAQFWGAVLGRDVDEGATAERASLVLRPGTADAPILFHGVPERKTVKNRIHLDLITADFETELQRLLGLGARELAAFERWTTLLDPEGNEFDLIRG